MVFCFLLVFPNACLMNGMKLEIINYTQTVFVINPYFIKLGAGD
jgi:hypothetical protein